MSMANENSVIPPHGSNLSALVNHMRSSAQGSSLSPEHITGSADINGIPDSQSDTVVASRKMESAAEYRHRILITGGAGFIGSHVVLLFVRRYPDYLVVNLDKLDYCASIKNLQSVENEANYVFIKGDICDVQLMQKVFAEYQIDVVIHFAAQTHVDISFWSSLDFTVTNVLGTHILLDVARKFDVKRFIHVSTDEVYGGSKQSMDEDFPLNPTSPYSASKAAAECIVRSYWKSFKFPVIITRANNVYGPQQYPEKVVPKFISLLNRNEKCPVYGPGTAVRSFLYADDIAEAFDVVMHKGVLGEAYNIGTDFALSIYDLAAALIKKMKGIENKEEAEKYMNFVKDRPLNDSAYPLDCKKIEALGWQPKIPWDEGIQKTIEWYCDPENFNSWNQPEHALIAVAHSAEDHVHRLRDSFVKPQPAVQNKNCSAEQNTS